MVRERVLIVEGDKAYAKHVAASLNQARPGYDADFAASMQHAHERLSPGRYACVLLDPELPDAEGLEALKQLVWLAGSPVLVLTSGESDALAQKALALGAQDYLPKTLAGSEHLLRAIRYARTRFELTRAYRRQHHLAELLDRIPVGLVAISPDGSEQFVNARARNLLEDSMEPGMSYADRLLQVEHASSRQPVAPQDHPLSHALTGAESERDDIAVEIDGVRRRLEVLGSAITDADGAVTSGVAVFHDVTARHEMQEHLRVAQRNEALGRLAAGVAHDFNNVLTSILAFTSLAQRANCDPKVEEDLQQVIKAAHRAEGLTRQLLTFVRRQPMQPAVLEIDALVDDLEPMLQRLIGEDVALDMNLQAPHVLIEVDEATFQQVIVNLVVNARDAMPEGGTLRISTDMSVAHHVRLMVVDSGHGIPDALQDTIFEPLFTTKPVGQGTGLGLSTCKSVVEQATGTIAVASRPGETVFTITLPVALAERVERRTTAEEFMGVLQEPRTVLIVEDEEAVRESAVRVLTFAGYDVVEASSAEDALELLTTTATAVDVVLADVILPGATGVELERAMRERNLHIPTVLMSGYNAHALETRASVTAERFVLPKPFTPGQLLAAVGGAPSAPA